MERKQVYKNSDGVRRTLIEDEAEPSVIRVYTEQVLDEILSGVHRDRELQKDRSVNKLLARLPISIYERAVHEKWDEDDWRKYLNSSEAAPFRIWRGQI